MLFDKWKFVFYSRLAQLSRFNELLFHISINKYFPNIYEIRNAYLRNYIKSIKHEFYILSSVHLFMWSSIMQICFSVFFYKKINLKKVILYIVMFIWLILIILVIIYVFIVKKYIIYTNILSDTIPVFMVYSNKIINNIFNYLIIIGL